MKYLLTIILLAFSLSVSAKKIKGSVIQDGDTTEVMFAIPINILGEVALVKLYNKVKIYEGKKKSTLKPKLGCELLFNFKSINYHFISMPNYEDGSSFSLFGNSRFKEEMGFMQVLYNSNSIQLVKALTFEHSQNFNTGIPGGAPTSSTIKKIVDVIKIKGKEYFKPTLINFRKKAKRYFIECKELCDKLNTREFERYDLWKIAKFYDKNCK